jgi:hypothetical protein
MSAHSATITEPKAPCSCPSAWQSIVIADGVTIGSVKETATWLLFYSGFATRILRSEARNRRALLTRVALYLALDPAASDGADDALELVLERMD